jgi:protein SCO1
MIKTVFSVFSVFSVVVLFVTAAHAQMAGTPAPGFKREVGQPASSIPAPLREIGFDQHIGDALPLDTPFRDEHGAAVRLRDFFGTRPVVMVFAYYDCPMLCTLSINGLASALNILSLDAGRDFEVVIVSFNPSDTPASAAAKKASYLTRYKRQGAEDGWHFLSGERDAIDRVTKAAGFRYTWDEATKQFAHPSGVMVVTPEGRLARYLFGIEYGPRDLRFALVEASAGTVGSPADALLLYCYHYDPMTGRYGLAIMRAIRLAGATTVLALGTFIVVMVRRDRTRGSTGSPRAKENARPELVEGRAR